MSKPVRYEDALNDCLDVMRAGGDIHAAVAGYPQHEAALRDDVRIAYALRRAAFSVAPPEGAETRASLRLANALREARAEAQPQRRALSPFGWLAGTLRPLALSGVAAAVLVVFALGATGSLSNPFGGAGTAQAATFEGVVVENKNGTLTLETPQGLTKVDVNQKPTVQDDALRLLSISDIEAGQVVRIEARKTPQGALIAKQVNRQPLNALQDWCADNGDACKEVAPRLETLTSQCRPSDQQCARIQQSVIDLQQGLKALAQRIQALRDRCNEGRDGAACRQLARACQDHAIVCADLKIRPGGGQPGQQRPQQRSNQGPSRSQ
jgi:hypothetical protein